MTDRGDKASEGLEADFLAGINISFYEIRETVCGAGPAASRRISGNHHAMVQRGADVRSLPVTRRAEACL
jgi:hypothetical protein